MKIREYSALTLQQRSLIDRVTSAQLEGRTYFAANKTEAAMMWRIECKGFGEVLLHKFKNASDVSTSLQLN